MNPSRYCLAGLLSTGIFQPLGCHTLHTLTDCPLNAQIRHIALKFKHNQMIKNVHALTGPHFGHDVDKFDPLSPLNDSVARG